MTKSRVVVKGDDGQLRVKEDVQGTLTADTYFYAVTATVDGTQDIIDLDKDDSVVLTATGSGLICWDAVSGAEKYSIYRILNGGSTPSNVTDFNGSMLTTVPGGAEYPFFYDDGSYTAGAGDQGAGANTPTIYGHVGEQNTRFPTALTSCAFIEVSYEKDGGVSTHAHGGDRRKTPALGSIELKGSIKRYKTDGRWEGAVAGWDRAGSTNSSTSYFNDVLGDGTGTYDGTTYTTSTNEQSPIARRMPKFELEIKDLKSENVPVTTVIKNVRLTGYKSGETADGELTETIDWAGDVTEGSYGASTSFS